MLVVTSVFPANAESQEPPPVIEPTEWADTYLNADSRPLWREEIATTTEVRATTTGIRNPLPDSCFCVRIARQAGLNLPFVDAENIKPNSGPALNGGIIFKYGKVSHIAVIKAFLKDGFWVFEGNKIPCKTGYRLVMYNDPAIVGFIK